MSNLASARSSGPDNNSESDAYGEEPATPEIDLDYSFTLCAGVLYTVAVPIGNLGDFTKRALSVLSQADVIASEEVQATKRLLASQNIHAKLISYREAGRDSAGSEIIALLQEGKRVALVSGAGTPAVSDPGRDVVARCHDLGLPVCPIPGASALTTALAACGLPVRRFAFEGFLPRSLPECKAFLRKLASESRTMVFFEAPHRLLKTLEAMLEVWGNRRSFIARELTKRFEQCQMFTLQELLEYYQTEPVRGEYVLIVEGAPEAEEAEAWDEELLGQDLAFLEHNELSSRGMADCLVRFRGLKPNAAKKIVNSWLRSKHEA